MSTNTNLVPDAVLTPLGRQQSVALYEETKGTIQKTAELIVSSPLRRPLSTMVIGYADLRKALESEGQKVIILPQLQEVNPPIFVFSRCCQVTDKDTQANSFPCDTGSVSTNPHSRCPLSTYRYLL